MPGTFTCSEDEDFGSLGDNKVIVTGGTSGTPATFADFVTADRAGEAVLLAATAGLSPTLALTFALRPVENLALLISFIVASKTAEADFIFITGTDFAGNAQTESLDVTAGNGTYVSTKYFATISNIDCSDNSGGGGTQWADGTVRVTQPQWGFIWDYGELQYQIDSNDLDFGNSSTSTYFTSAREKVTFSDGTLWKTTSSATLQLGELSGSYGINGSVWSMAPSSSFTFGSSGTILQYATMFENRAITAAVRFNNTHTVRNAIFQASRHESGGNFNSTFQWQGSATIDFEDIFITNVNEFNNSASSSTIADLWVHRCARGVQVNGTVTVSKAKITEVTGVLVRSATAGTVTMLDPLQTLSSVEGLNTSSIIIEQYSCNIQVVDRDGTVLESATVLCEDDDGNQIFSASTDSNGDITEQNMNYKSFTGTSETLEDFSPHKFSISKAGYETLVLEAVTVDHPLVWRLELQSQKQPPRAWRH